MAHIVSEGGGEEERELAKGVENQVTILAGFQTMIEKNWIAPSFPET